MSDAIHHILPPNINLSVLIECNYGNFVHPITKLHYRVEPHLAARVLSRCIGTCKASCGPITHATEKLNVTLPK